MIELISGLSGKCFSANIPNVTFAISGARAEVAMAVDNDVIYREVLVPFETKIALEGLSELIEPYAKRRLSLGLAITIKELNTAGEAVEELALQSFVVFSKADVSTSCEDFTERCFMSLMQGRRKTAIGRLELLSFVGESDVYALARYADLTTKVWPLVAVAGKADYPTVDASPAQFVQEGKLLVEYEIVAGARKQVYEIDFNTPDCAPIVIFDNSFGVEEVLYCTGTHKIAPQYKRESMYMGSLMKNFNIEETRAMTADTGVLSYEEAMWAEDLFRSEFVRVVNFYNGEPHIGKEIAITDCKAERTNDANALPRFSFTYQYAQRNHNVLDLRRTGRVFDNTFDNTFE